jgi:threonine/homoserine/homoserine lactone efflux protein
MPLLFSAEEIVTYLLVVIVILVIPGPAVLLTVARSITGGRTVGVATAAGIATGDAVHTLLAIFGLSAVLMTSALAFSIVKYAGVAYLLYLGIRSLLERPADLHLPTARVVQPYAAFRQAVIAEVLNPKTALFFLAFLPQFVHPDRGFVELQLGILGGAFLALGFLETAAIAIAAHVLSRRIARNARWGRYRGKLAGTLFVGLGVHLAAQERA